MDLYDFTREKFEKSDQKKLLKYTVIIASILIVLIIAFIIYIFRAADSGKHLFSYTQKRNEEREKEIKERDEKLLEDPDTREIYDKYFVDRDFSL